MHKSIECWDVFISHATEDNEEIARPLAEALTNAGLRVWFDEFSLQVGQSISESINYGLSNSVYGIVILSANYLKKDWTRRELAGLFAKEQNEKIILPIWHKISFQEIRTYSPILADRYAVNSDIGIPNLTAEFLKVLRPDHPLLQSPLHYKVNLLQFIDNPKKQLVGLWGGASGGLRLFKRKSEKYDIEGDFDWQGYKWAGHIAGNYYQGVLRFYWWWDFSPERGSGYFVVDPVSHTLRGGWVDDNIGVNFMNKSEIILPESFNEWMFNQVDWLLATTDLWNE